MTTFNGIELFEYIKKRCPIQWKVIKAFCDNENKPMTSRQIRAIAGISSSQWNNARWQLTSYGNDMYGSGPLKHRQYGKWNIQPNSFPEALKARRRVL